MGPQARQEYLAAAGPVRAGVAEGEGAHAHGGGDGHGLPSEGDHSRLAGTRGTADTWAAAGPPDALWAHRGARTPGGLGGGGPIPAWLVSTRDAGAAFEFMQDVASRLRGRVQLTTDGHNPYLAAVEDAFGVDIDYATLTKLYGIVPAERRHSPPVCLGCDVKTVTGNPDPKHISTSYVERSNPSMRMSMRRFTRSTSAFSRKVENHAAAVALYFMWYNFGRVHQTLRVTPAMETGVSDHVWSVEEIVALL